MTPTEIERFITAQLSMGARIAQKAARARIAAAAFTKVRDAKGRSLGDRIVAAIDRPGVAPSSRPLSKDGKQSFHFALTPISKSSAFGQATKSQKSGKASEHAGYIEREGAAEVLDPEIRRKAEEIDKDTWLILGGQSYIERPDAAEVMPDGRTLASFGNIAATLEERVAYWTAMEEAAPTPKSHGIVADRRNDPEFWRRVDADTGAPQRLRDVPPWIPLPAPESDPDAEVKNRSTPPPRVKDDEAIEIARYVAKHRTRTKGEKKAVEIDPGRGGRIQNRLIVELPFELTAEQRLKLAQDFCHRQYVEGREQPIPHWCVIHAPDHHNDARNCHMHIVFAERPARRMKDPTTGMDVWDFQIVETTTDKHYNKRSRRPFEQPADRSINGPKAVRAARKAYADLANDALKDAGRSKRYDARSYREMGIEVKPNIHIGRTDYTNEKKGISTAAGDPVVARQWETEEERLAARHATIRPDREKYNKFIEESNRWRRSPTSNWIMLRSYGKEWWIANAHRKFYAAEAAANALVMRKIRSKLAPPLGTDNETTGTVVDYLKMFKRDLIDQNGKEAARWLATERYAVKRLREIRAQDPKTLTMEASLSASPFGPVMQATMAWAKAEVRAGDAQTMDQIAARITASVAEASAAGQARAAARRDVIDAMNGWTETIGSQVRSDIPKAPDGATPRWGSTDGGRTLLPEEAPPRPRTQTPNTVAMTFLSDTGAPIQRRVISTTSVEAALAKAAALEARLAGEKAARAALRDAADAAEERVKAARAAEQRRREGQDMLAQMRETVRARNAGAAASKPASAAAPTAAPARTADDAAKPRAPVEKPDTLGHAEPLQTARPAADGIHVKHPTPPASPAPEPATDAQKGSPIRPPDGPRSAPATEPSLSSTPEAAAAKREPDPNSTRATNPQPVERPVASKAASEDDMSGRTLETALRHDPVAPPSATVDTTTEATGASARATTAIDTPPPTDGDGTPPRKKKRVPTAEQIRQRALLAAKNRGRGR